ncbi:MAG: lipid A deacylase LpxR family protein [Leeuwenhoekiella sp.]
MVRLCSFLLLFLISWHTQAQKIDNLVSYRNMGTQHYFRFNYENDFFAATDENYTQGYSFEYVSEALKKNPANQLFFKLKGFSSIFGIALEHIGYTPNDYVSREIQNGDRPFASAIFLKSFSTANNEKHMYRFSQSLSLGIIGAAALGKEMQVEIHKWTGNKIPRGWEHQIKNDLVLNYRLDCEKQFFRWNNFLTLNASSSVQLGTLFTNAAAGANMQLGLLENTSTSSGKKSKFRIYFYGEGISRFIGYDATLQGGMLNRSSPYVISSRDVSRIVGQINYGLVLKTGPVYLEYARTTITREFKTGNPAGWGGIKVGVGF